MGLKKRTHYILLVCMLAFTAVCGFLIPEIRVNSDMTLYLPDDSRMKQGLAIINSEFGGSQMTGPGIHVLFGELDRERIASITDSLSSIPEVSGVTSKLSQDGGHVLFDLNVPGSIDQKALGQEIASRYPGVQTVETSQDGNTPPVSVLIIACALILLILTIMAQSWLEPFIFLLTTGIAAVMNMGTNALLPNVSITTNYIAAVLQMVLSLDYSIVLMNRYRQEKTASNTPVEAVNLAIRRAVPPVLSSAATTVVGLVMLVFMRLKIGMDLGIVLAKGVLFSLLCTFTVLPSLLILFHKGVMNTGKKTFVLPTDRISRFVTRHKALLACVTLVLFVFSFYWSKKTDISFCMETDSEIGRLFPRENPVVTVYPTAMESEIPALAEKISEYEGVEGIVSYPTIMRKQYSPAGMSAQMAAMYRNFSDEVPSDFDTTLISEPIMRMVYAMKYDDDPARRLTFPQLMDFIRENCLGNPLFDAAIDDDMREKIALLDSFAPLEQEESPAQEAVKEESVPASLPAEKAAVKKENPASVKKDTSSDVHTASRISSETSAKPASEASSGSGSGRGTVRLSEFMTKFAASYNSLELNQLSSLSDKAAINTPMDVAQMSSFMGSTMAQTRMVYSFSKNKSKKMTPYEYVHFLNDDLFQRKSLAAFVSADQKKGLQQRLYYMELIQKDASMTVPELSAFLGDFGAAPSDQSSIAALLRSSKPSPAVRDSTAPARHEDVAAPSVHPSQPIDTMAVLQPAQAADSCLTASARDTLSIPAAELLPARKPAPKPKKTAEELRQELFMDLMYSGRAYTAERMSQYFRRLGQPVDKGLLSLLYVFYASETSPQTHTMSIEELLSFLGDELLADPRLSGYIDDSSRSSFDTFRSSFTEKLGMMRNDEHSILLVLTSLPQESAQTYAFIDDMNTLCGETFGDGSYLVGESVMYSEMKNGFGREINLVTILTVLAIFLIVAISFRSIIVPLILVMTVMTAVYVNVIFSGIFSGTMLYLAYLIVQSILMGATIDYGILYANYYTEYRRSMDVKDAVAAAYRGFIRTIMTSGLIMIAAAGAMAVLVDDLAISAIVGSLSIGAFVSVCMILLAVPAVLAACDRLVVHKAKKRNK